MLDPPILGCQLLPHVKKGPRMMLLRLDGAGRIPQAVALTLRYGLGDQPLQPRPMPVARTHEQAPLAHGQGPRRHHGQVEANGHPVAGH